MTTPPHSTGGAPSSGDKYEQLAAAILPLLGGADNIGSVTNCITRLRVGLADRSRVDDRALRATPGVLGVVDDETYQVVLGPGAVAKVTAAFTRRLETERAAGPTAAPTGDAAVRLDTVERGARLKAQQKARNNTPFKNLLRKIANIFVPLIPALIGAGLVAAIRGVLANLVTSGQADWATSLLPALTAIGTAFFAFLTIFAGINAAKEFGGTPALGGAVAAIIVFPGVANITYTLPLVGEVTLAPGQGGVLGAIMAAILCAYIERGVRGRVPDALDILVTPTVALLVSGLATIYVLMFAAGQVATGIATAATWLFEVSGVAAGFVLGGLFLPLVMLGLHQALIPIHATLIEQVGYTTLLPILAMAGAGQVGCAAAVYLKLKYNKGIREIIKGALPVGVLGVGEPLIYGVSLPLGRPFITACLGGAVAGGVVGAFNQFVAPFGATAIGPSGLALVPLVTGPGGQLYSIGVYVLGLAVGYVAGFVLTWFFGFPKALLDEHNRNEGEFDVPHPGAAERAVAVH
jgi:PTS system sucrose-specific IIC component